MCKFFIPFTVSERWLHWNSLVPDNSDLGITCSHSLLSQSVQICGKTLYYSHAKKLFLEVYGNQPVCLSVCVSVYPSVYKILVILCFDLSINMALVNGGFSHYRSMKKFLKNLLLRNCWSDFEIISQECSLGDPFQKLFAKF